MNPMGGLFQKEILIFGKVWVVSGKNGTLENTSHNPSSAVCSLLGKHRAKW